MKKSISSRVTSWGWFSRPTLMYIAFAVVTAQAQTYQGADAALRQVEERNSKPGEKDQKTNAQSQLRADLREFSEGASNLPPADAARRWLELVDRAVKVQQQASRSFDPSTIPLGAEDVLGALPPPADWDELATAIAARQTAKSQGVASEIGLRFLAAALTGDTNGRTREITNLQEQAKDAGEPSSYVYRNFLQQISQSMLVMSDDPDAILKSLERQLDSAGEGRMPQLEVPNLVSEVGADKAEAFLRKALITPNVRIQFQTANETSRLAQKLALELVDQLKSAQWGLVNSLDGVELYEALDKRFGAETNKPAPIPGLPEGVEVPTDMDGLDINNKTQAKLYYMLGLIAKDRAKDAVVVAKKLSGQGRMYFAEETFNTMERAGYTSALDNFFYELLSQDPTLSFWDEYVPLAAKNGTTDRMLTLARAAAAREDLSDNKKAVIHQVLFKALLAADAVDEGVEEMRRLIALDDSDTPAPGYEESKGQLGVMLAQIGVLLQKPEWTDEGVGVAKAWLAKSSGQNQAQWEMGSIVHSLNEILLQLKRGPESESILTDALALSTRENKNPNQYEYDAGGGGLPRQVLAEMAVLYYQAGRQGDVLTLLQQSPDWGAKDLSELFESPEVQDGVSLMSLHTGSSALPVGYLAANALLAGGHNEQAGKIIDELLNREPALDRGYELLLALKGTNVIPRLNELFAQDQFEERPLIWKAHVLRQENQLAEAEKTIRQAIAIDPSEGEEGRGDRMRAYAELADIREAQGDLKEADSMREIVKAIRISEDADQFYAAGLLKRAIPMYEEGLTHFADAYCIQSRLAIQLSELGKNAEAEEHYRRAYELMPDSFGRVESHCFGCERVFEGERPQSIAEQVFTKLVAERPDKPQVHYLLGYLREEQERYNEAATNYLEATRLDPNYLNAWARLDGISQHILMPPEERDEIVFNILRLDPRQRHQTPNLSRVTNLAGLWNAVDAATRLRPAPATNLYTLTASKAALEKKESSASPESMAEQWRERQESEGQALSPSVAVSQTPFVQLSGQMIMNGNSLTDE